MSQKLSENSDLPSFDQFNRWLAARLDRPGVRPEGYQVLREAARSARDEFVTALAAAAGSVGSEADAQIEVLSLLAAADRSASSELPEIVTQRGFRILFAPGDAEAGGGEAPSVGVLVHCPAGSIPALEGKTVHLWYGTQRIELGQLDGEGKAIGTLPPGMQITAADLAQGKVKLEEPLADR